MGTMLYFGEQSWASEILTNNQKEKVLISCWNELTSKKSGAVGGKSKTGGGGGYDPFPPFGSAKLVMCTSTK